MSAQKTCEQIIQRLINSGYRLQVPKKDVEKAIMYVRGIDERTINRWLKALAMFGYLKPVSPTIYELNPLQIPELMALLKEKPQVKLQ